MSYMSKNVPRSPKHSTEPSGGFLEVVNLLNRRFEDAVVADYTNERYVFFTTGWRSALGQRLGNFSLASSMRALRQNRAETLEFGIPIERGDATMPLSTLGREPGAHFFTMTYMARRGGEKTLVVDESLFRRRFEGNLKPPVADLAHKLLTFTVVPMHEAPPQQDDAGELQDPDGLTE